MNQKKTALRTLFSFLIFSLMPLSTVAAEQPSITVNATVIVASNQGTDFNLDNDAFRDQLIKLFSYTSYNQVSVSAMKLPRSERVTLDLTEGYELTLTLQEQEDSRVLVQAVIRKGNQQYVDTVLSILRPGVAFLGGPPSKSGGSLIIVLETGF